RGLREPLEVVVPTVRVRLGRLGAGEVAVLEPEPRPRTFRHELDFDRARARRDAVRPLLAVFPAPGEDEPVWRVELDEFASRGMARGHADPVQTSGPRLERRRLAHPANRLVPVDPQF